MEDSSSQRSTASFPAEGDEPTIVQVKQLNRFTKTNDLCQNEEAALEKRAGGAMFMYSPTVNAIVVFSGTAFAFFGKTATCAQALWISYLFMLSFGISLLVSTCLAFSRLRMVEELMSDITTRRSSLHKQVRRFLEVHYPQLPTSPTAVASTTANGGGGNASEIAVTPESGQQNALPRESSFVTQVRGLKEKLNTEENKLQGRLSKYRWMVGFTALSMGLYCLTMPLLGYLFMCSAGAAASACPSPPPPPSSVGVLQVKSGIFSSDKMTSEKSSLNSVYN